MDHYQEMIDEESPQTVTDLDVSRVDLIEHIMHREFLPGYSDPWITTRHF